MKKIREPEFIPRVTLDDHHKGGSFEEALKIAKERARIVQIERERGVHVMPNRYKFVMSDGRVLEGVR